MQQTKCKEQFAIVVQFVEQRYKLQVSSRISHFLYVIFWTTTCAMEIECSISQALCFVGVGCLFCSPCFEAEGIVTLNLAATKTRQVSSGYFLSCIVTALVDFHF